MKIELCMGSSCFARGNALVLEQLETLLKNEPEVEVDLSGHLCLNECSNGPNIRIDGELYQNLSAQEIIEIIKKKSSEEQVKS